MPHEHLLDFHLCTEEQNHVVIKLELTLLFSVQANDDSKCYVL